MSSYEITRLADEDKVVINPATEDKQDTIITALGLLASSLIDNKISGINSSETLLEAAASFTGDWEDVLDYSSIIIGIIADQNSATDGLSVQWSSDGIDVAQETQYSLLADVGQSIVLTPTNRYVKIIFTNGSITQTSFNLQVILKK